MKTNLGLVAPSGVCGPSPVSSEESLPSFEPSEPSVSLGESPPAAAEEEDDSMMIEEPPSASSLSALDGHDLDLDDDEEENDIDSERGDGKAADGGGLPVPIIIARPNRMGSIDSASSSSSSYGYGNDGSQSPVRTSVMFGRPSTASAHHHQGPIMMTQRVTPEARPNFLGGKQYTSLT